MTKTEIDEDRDGRRRRLSKTETVEDEDRLTLGTREVAVPLQLTTSRVTKAELDTSLIRPADSRAHEGCSSLCSPRSGRGTAPALPFLSLLSGNCCANWSYRRLTTECLAHRPKLNGEFSSSFSTVSCPKRAVSCSVGAHHI